jgi:hypothetical protein
MHMRSFEGCSFRARSVVCYQPKRNIQLQVKYRGGTHLGGDIGDDKKSEGAGLEENVTWPAEESAIATAR